MPLDAVNRMAKSWQERCLFLAAALAILPVQGCAPKSGPKDCFREPASAMTVYVDSRSPTPSRFRGTVTEIDTAAADGFVVVTVRDSLLVERKIHVSAAGSSLPLRKGPAYDFQIESVGGFPSASGLIVRDSTGILYAGASDQTVGGHVLKDGVPGFALTLESAGCPSRPHDDCYDGLYNLRLSVTHAGQTIRLMHPETGRVDAYAITCLVAQRVDYNGKCADAGLQGVSWTIERTNPAARKGASNTK
jgi:hypothetical protein